MAIAAHAPMLARRILLVASSFLTGACTDRDATDSPTSDDTTTATDGDTDTDATTLEDTGTTTAPAMTTDGSDGAPPSDCDGNPPTCFQDEPGICAHIVDELPASCEARAWSCPEGYAFEADLQCTPEEDVACTEGELCWIGGDCAAESYAPTCVGGSPTCGQDDALDCEWLCEPGDVPPDDCYDQGPGECADYAPPPNCTRGVWTCPNGFDFGGYGEGCEFPG